MQHRIKVYGPPGTGKTKHCLDLLCEHLQAGDRVLFLSFTRGAKLEAEGRMLKTFGTVPEHATVKTIHALCLGILGIGVDLLFERKNPKVKFYSSLNTTPAGNSKRRNVIAEALAAHNLARNLCEMIRDKEALPFSDPANTESIIAHFEGWKRHEGYLDFTDLLVRVANGEGVVDPHTVVIIDEAQDLTTLQWKVADRLYAEASMVYVVGDDDQAIYSFLGADVNHFLTWPCDAINTLDYTYRLPKNVLAYAARLAVQIAGRQRKTVTGADRQGLILADINLLERLNYGTRATELYLTRNEYMLRRVERELRRQGIPYKSKFSPYTSTYGYEGRAFQAIALLHQWRTQPLYLKDWKKMKSVLRPSFIEMIEDHYEAAVEIRPEGIPTLSTIFARHPNEFEELGWWEPFFHTMSAQTTSMFRNTLGLHSLEACVKPTLELSTIHGAKGKEADRVYVCSALTDKLYRGLETRYDEHRLFYVAVTRTRDELIIVHDPEAGKNRYSFPTVED